MDNAIDNLTNLRIDADDAEKGEFWDHYRCPECREAVIYAGGPDTHQRAHFRHGTKEDDAYCSRRVLGGRGGIPPPFFERDTVSRAFNLVCGLASQQKVFFGIRVVLTAPAKEIAILQAGRTTRRHVADARPIAWISHPEPKYKLNIRLQNGSDRSLEADGFNADKHIFQAIGQLGALVTTNAHLQRGDYFILQKGAELSLPASFNLQPLQFRDGDNFKGWSVFSFTVPEEVSEGARSWFAGATGYVIGRASIKSAILHPRAVYGLGNDSWQIEAGAGWSVLVKFPPDHSCDIDFYVQRRTVDLQYAAQEIHFSTALTNGLALIEGHAEYATEGTVYRIAVRGNGKIALLVELSCVRVIHEPQCDRLGFVIDGGRLLWSSHVLAKSLVRVREEQSRLTKIEIPPGLKVTARADGKEQKISGEADLVAFTKSTQSAIRLHAEGHGSLQIKGVVIRKFSRRNDCNSSVRRSLSEGPLADAYMRGQVSEYAASVTSDGNH